MSNVRPHICKGPDRIAKGHQKAGRISRARGIERYGDRRTPPDFSLIPKAYT